MPTAAQEQEKTCAESVPTARQAKALTMAASARMQRMQRFDRVEAIRIQRRVDGKNAGTAAEM